MKNISIVLSGVGGQGIVLASDLIGEVALIHGFDVKKADVHGMAQRGGSVVSHVRFGEKVFSPLVEKGKADILCAFEPLEMLRYIDYVNKNSYIFFNTEKIYPLTVFWGKIPYPDNPEKIALQYSNNVYKIEALSIAKKLGIQRVINLVMLGAISSLLPFSEDEWNEAISKKIRPEFIEENKKAFIMGREVINC